MAMFNGRVPLHRGANGHEESSGTNDDLHATGFECKRGDSRADFRSEALELQRILYWLVSRFDHSLEADVNPTFLENFNTVLDQWPEMERVFRARHKFEGCIQLGTRHCDVSGPILCDFCAGESVLGDYVRHGGAWVRDIEAKRRQGALMTSAKSVYE